jgi:hypothetical protein
MDRLSLALGAMMAISSADCTSSDTAQTRRQCDDLLMQFGFANQIEHKGPAFWLSVDCDRSKSNLDRMKELQRQMRLRGCPFSDSETEKAIAGLRAQLGQISCPSANKK